MRANWAVMLAGTAMALSGCGNTQTSGVVAIGPDTYAVETRGRALATAVERGLTEATSFCTAQSRQTELLGTRINADSYQVAFRCTGGMGLAGNPGVMGRVPVGYGTRNSSMGPIPISAPVASGGRGPVISGPAFPPQAPPPVGFDLGTVGAVPGRTATVVGNPFATTASAPAAPPLRSLPPVSSLTAPAPASVQASVPPSSPSPFAPLTSPLATGPAISAPAPVFTPAAAPAPAFTPAFTPAPAASAPPPASPAFAPLTSPLTSPLAAAPAAAPAATFTPSPAPAFQPLSSPVPNAPSSGGASPAFSALPPASSALQPVASPSRGATSVPAAAAGEPLPGGTVPPAAFWNSSTR